MCATRGLSVSGSLQLRSSTPPLLRSPLCAFVHVLACSLARFASWLALHAGAFARLLACSLARCARLGHHTRGTECLVRAMLHSGESEGLRLFGGLMRGIGYLHSLRVVHRDIKLENVVLDERRNPRLIDFGAAQEVRFGERLSVLQGTPGYMAPEVLSAALARSGQYDGMPADIWSCGVSLYCLFNQTSLPWGGRDINALAVNVQRREPPPCPHMPIQAQYLMTQLLKKSPAARPTAQQALSHAWFTTATRSSALTSGETPRAANSARALADPLSRSQPPTQPTSESPPAGLRAPSYQPNYHVSALPREEPRTASSRPSTPRDRKAEWAANVDSASHLNGIAGAAAADGADSSLGRPAGRSTRPEVWGASAAKRAAGYSAGSAVEKPPTMGVAGGGRCDGGAYKVAPGANPGAAAAACEFCASVSCRDLSYLGLR